MLCFWWIKKRRTFNRKIFRWNMQNDIMKSCTVFEPETWMCVFEKKNPIWNNCCVSIILINNVEKVCWKLFEHLNWCYQWERITWLSKSSANYILIYFFLFKRTVWSGESSLIINKASFFQGTDKIMWLKNFMFRIQPIPFDSTRYVNVNISWAKFS